MSMGAQQRSADVITITIATPKTRGMIACANRYMLPYRRQLLGPVGL
jgi:hypothetical protein